VLPVDRQVRFRLTSSSVMNTFYVPAMAGMIYTMPGMETKLHAVLNRPGRFEGGSANYSGRGFSEMRFPTLAMDDTGFDRWVAAVKGAGRPLDPAGYLKLEEPSEKVPAMRFAGVQPGLFDKVVMMCVDPRRPCMQHGGTNDRPAQSGRPEGALQKDAGEKGASPHSSAPHGTPGGNDAPSDDQSNRNMTRLDLPTPTYRAFGTAATARS
jgi:cytochrome o ubiquinol oxidase subunit 2